MKVSKMEDGGPEIFASIQGEGSSIQESCVFVRMALCNLKCNYCDSAYTWRFGSTESVPFQKAFSRKEQIMEMTPEEMEIEIRRVAGKLRRVVFTGGEPLLQQLEINKVIELLERDGDYWYVEFETNGTLEFKDIDMVDQINCSPKLASSGNDSSRHNKKVIKSYITASEKLHTIVNFKFVVGDNTFDEDIKEIRKWEKDIGCPRELIYLMPEGVEPDKILSGTRKLVEVCNKYGYKLSTRLQILLWGNKRGV